MSEANLKTRRKDVGLTQQKLAELAECSVATVALLENGYQPASSEVLTRIERVIATHEKRKVA